MPRTFRQMPTFNGVAASSTATCNLPIGATYHGILLEFGGTTMEATNIDEIRVKANGRTIFTADGGDLDSMNKFDGRAASVDHLYIDFERYGLKTRAATELTALGTGAPQSNEPGPNFNPVPISTLQLEVDIDGSASAPTLSAKASQSAARPLGLIRHRRKFSYSPAGSGDFEIADFPKGLLIDKVYLKQTTLTINSVKVDRDNFRLFDRTAAQNNVMQNDGVRTSQSGWFVYDPTEDGYGAESLATKGVQDLRFIVNCSAAGTITAYVDYVGGFAG